MAIANALQLEAARATPAPFRFNYDAMPSLKSLNYSVFAADTLLYAVTLTFHLEHMQRITCDVTKFCTKFERNRANRGGVVAISVFDLMTLNLALCVALVSGIISTKFNLRQLIRG